MTGSPSWSSQGQEQVIQRPSEGSRPGRPWSLKEEALRAILLWASSPTSEGTEEAPGR